MKGDVLNLAEVLKRSVANPAVRRAELMVRLRGFEDYANGKGHTALFYTITTPSKYHRTSGAGLNDKYQDYTPRDAQAYLCDVWARIRAKLKREELNVYGFRVAEPHHDGTPHWHILLFMPADQAKSVSAIIRDYAMQEDGTEAGADKHRFEAVAIKSDKGSATGYIAKYVSKNIDGFGLGRPAMPLLNQQTVFAHGLPAGGFVSFSRLVAHRWVCGVNYGALKLHRMDYLRKPAGQQMPVTGRLI